MRGGGLVSLFAERQGIVQFGTSPATDECEVHDVVTTVAHDRDVYWAALLKRSVRTGETASIEVSLEGTRIESGSYFAAELTPCLLSEPFQLNVPGKYAVRILVGEEVLAEGSLIVE